MKIFRALNVILVRVALISDNLGHFILHIKPAVFQRLYFGQRKCALIWN